MYVLYALFTNISGGYAIPRSPLISPFPSFMTKVMFQLVSRDGALLLITMFSQTSFFAHDFLVVAHLFNRLLSSIPHFFTCIFTFSLYSYTHCLVTPTAWATSVGFFELVHKHNCFSSLTGVSNCNVIVLLNFSLKFLYNYVV